MLLSSTGFLLSQVSLGLAQRSQFAFAIAWRFHTQSDYSRRNGDYNFISLTAYWTRAGFGFAPPDLHSWSSVANVPKSVRLVGHG